MRQTGEQIEEVTDVEQIGVPETPANTTRAKPQTCHPYPPAPSIIWCTSSMTHSWTSSPRVSFSSSSQPPSPATWSWFAIRIAAEKRNDAVVTETYELVSKLPKFEEKMKANRALWGEIQKIRTRHYTSEKRKQTNWRALQGMVDEETHLVWQKEGASTYTGNSRASLKTKPERRSGLILTAAMQRIGENCKK